MTDREKLPTKASTRDVAVPTEQRGSLVARGLAAIRDLEKQQLALTTETDAESQFRQGKRYRYGENGTQVDDDRAREYLTAASERDHAEAQYELAYLLGEIGEQGEPDKWMERSAHLGFGPGLLYLAQWSDDRSEEERDDLFLKAREWYLPRAIAGDAEAQCMLGWWLEDGEERYRWLKASAEQDYPDACYYLGKIYLKDKVAEDATRQGIYWLSHAVDLGHWNACRDLAKLYLLGHEGSLYASGGKPSPPRVIEPDRKMAVSWYERGIELGVRTMAFDLGHLYLVGEHLNQNLQLAEKWLLHSANRGYSSAQLVLGKEYASGARLRQDTDAAIHWLRLAAENYKSTGLTLAEIYLEGKIIPKNFDEAIKWLTCAAESGTFRNDAMKMVAEKCFDGRFDAAEESAAQAWLAQMAAMTLESIADMKSPRLGHNALHLAELYELGLGVEQDREKAIYWYKQSAELGVRKANERLQELGVDWKPV